MFNTTAKLSQQAAGLTIHPSLSLFDSPSPSTSPRLASTSSRESPKPSKPTPSLSLIGSPSSSSIPAPSLLAHSGLPSSSSLTKLRLKTRDQQAEVNRDVNDVENSNPDYMNLGKMQTGDRDGKGYFSGDMEEWDDCSSEVTEMGKKNSVEEGGKINGDYDEGRTPTLEAFKKGSDLP